MIDPQEVIDFGPWQVPVGTIMPYLKERVPEGWRVWDGSELDLNDYPELKAVYDPVWDFLKPMWNGFGGRREGDLLYLPHVTSDACWALLGGIVKKDTDNMVMAVKVRNTEIPPG